MGITKNLLTKDDTQLHCAFLYMLVPVICDLSKVSWKQWHRDTLASSCNTLGMIITGCMEHTLKWATRCSLLCHKPQCDS